MGHSDKTVVTENNTGPKAGGSPQAAVVPVPTAPKEYGGPKGPEPTRYGDWEKKGRCIDF
jgi:hypothetical protein